MNILINNINNQDVSINHLANNNKEIMNQKDESIKSKKIFISEQHDNKSLIKESDINNKNNDLNKENIKEINNKINHLTSFTC